MLAVAMGGVQRDASLQAKRENGDGCVVCERAVARSLYAEMALLLLCSAERWGGALGG